MTGPDPWTQAATAAALLAIDPAGLGGVALRALPGPVRDRWLEDLRTLLPEGTPWRRLPLHAGDAALFGGLDLAATLAAGRPILQRGLLAAADSGIVLLAMAERLPMAGAARLTPVLDTSEVRLERDGLAGRFDARIGIVALDEGADPDERPPSALLDRLAFHLDLAPVTVRVAAGGVAGREEVALARVRLSTVQAGADAVEALCGAAAALGIDSLRAPLLALRTARASAALFGRATVEAEDLALAGQLVLAPRATRMPAAAPEELPPEPPATEEPTSLPDSAPPEEVVLAAVQAALPAEVLAGLRLAGALGRSRATGRAGARASSAMRGRPSGVRHGEPRGGARLSVIETLRAAAPWQPLRRRGGGPRIEVRRDDFRVTRHKERLRTTTIFVVDASGSAAFQRLAEAKGAVELLLAECYVRRDQVALLAFRGAGAELLLPPTRSLVRAKRSLAGLPGGGGTPLAAGIEAAVTLADAVRRRGESPVLVVLTDGRANIARDGTPGRAQAGAEALAAAKRWCGAGLGGLLVDTASQPQAKARELAAAMAARYLPLPYADASALSRAVRAAAAPVA